MALSILQAIDRIKSEVASVLREETIVSLCRELGHGWRRRCLDPVTTVHAFLIQILHGNTACEHLPHLLGRRFTGAAYCMARSRLPLELFQRLLQKMCDTLRGCRNDVSSWHGHRIWLMDGSSCSMSDTADLQKAFGQPPGQKAGCGFPVANLLVLFDLGTGFLMRIGAAPLRSHEMSRAATFHVEMQQGDVLVGDRGFCSYAHLALLVQAGIHGLFRIHHQTIVNFRKGRPHASTGSLNNRRRSTGRPRSRWIKWLGHVDQIVEYVKPWERPPWMTVEAYAVIPASVRVRELRYRIDHKGFRTREVLLVTTLLDHTRYCSADLAELYGKRWQVETNLRHLKQTLGMDILRTKSVENLLKELAMYAIVYNLVRLVMLKASQQQDTDLERISFMDALCWLRSPAIGEGVSRLVRVPLRKGRVEPRVQKRRVKQYSLMTQPRDELRRQLPLPGYA